MSNPLRQLKYLPWLSLALTGFATALMVFIGEVILLVSAQYVPGVANVLQILFSPVLVMVVWFAIAFGIGTLAVYWLEKVYPRLVITAGVLWALVLCVILAILVKSLLPLTVNLVGVDQILMAGILVGVFWKGRRYWRR
ncbi:peptide chain release factor 1 [Egbenema bharatensis]|uniref:peptide chain release factor 1 n=1 Tax=Egbenema bharatensis TaxID=3463334 RepID=UPI003A8BD38A